MFVGFRALTVADVVSSFDPQSKKTVFKIIQANSESRRLLYHIRRKKHLSEKDIADVTKFLTKFLYNDKQSSTLAQARAKKWKVMKTKTTLGFPPDKVPSRTTLNLRQLLKIHNTMVTLLMYNISFQCTILNCISRCSAKS